MKPLDTDLVAKLVAEHDVLITIEEGSIGGFGDHVLHYLALNGMLDNGSIKARATPPTPGEAPSPHPHRIYSQPHPHLTSPLPSPPRPTSLAPPLSPHRHQVRPMVLPDKYFEAGTQAEQYEEAGLNARYIEATALKLLGRDSAPLAPVSITPSESTIA